MVSSGAFISARLGDLDLMTAGWRYMRRTMSDADRLKFEEIINAPGFCVKKFEEMYLLKKINPFAQNQQTPVSPETFEVADSHDCKDILEMKSQLSELLVKWEQFFSKNGHDKPSLASSSAQILHKADQNTPEQTKKMGEEKKNTSGAKIMQIQSVNGENITNARNIKPPEAELKKKTYASIGKRVEPTGQTSNAAAGDVKRYNEIARNSRQKNEPVNIEMVASVSSGIKYVKPNPKQINGKLEELSCLIHKEGEAKTTSVSGDDESVSLPSPIQDSSPNPTDRGRAIGTPDSGMISDVSELKAQAQKNKKPEDPEKWTGRDGRRYRQKKKEAEMMEKMKLEEQNEDVDQLQESTTDETIKTGKEKRRLKDKLRKEKRTQEQSAPKENASSAPQLPETPPVDNDNEVLQTSAPEKQSSPQVEEPVETFTSSKTTEKDKETVESEESNVPEQTIETSIEKSPETNSADIELPVNNSQSLEKVKEIVEEPQKQLPAHSPSLAENNVLVVNTQEKTSTDQSEMEKKTKLSKKQKKQAKKAVQSGVYVVNDKEDKSHSVELSPGEFKIVTIDQQQLVEEIALKGPCREVNIDKSIEESEKAANEPKKPKNFLVAGNLSKNILDNGKWLAYVLDEKDPKNSKVGEVSNEQVAETIAHLNAQQEKHQRDLAEKKLTPLKKSPIKNTAILPELDADFVRKTFADLEEKIEGSGEALCVLFDSEETKEDDENFSDLKMFLETDDSCDIHFQTDFAQRTSHLLVKNSEFKEFCKKYSSSKYDSKVITTLIRKYIDTRIVYHFERFKKLADRESHRISQCWTHVSESSSYALMVMLFVNSPTSKIGFDDLEKTLFPPKFFGIPVQNLVAKYY